MSKTLRDSAGSNYYGPHDYYFDEDPLNIYKNFSNNNNFSNNYEHPNSHLFTVSEISENIPHNDTASDNQESSQFLLFKSPKPSTPSNPATVSSSFSYPSITLSNPSHVPTNVSSTSPFHGSMRAQTQTSQETSTDTSLLVTPQVSPRRITPPSTRSPKSKTPQQRLSPTQFYQHTNPYLQPAQSSVMPGVNYMDNQTIPNSNAYFPPSPNSFPNLQYNGNYQNVEMHMHIPQQYYQTPNYSNVPTTMHPNVFSPNMLVNQEAPAYPTIPKQQPFVPQLPKFYKFEENEDKSFLLLSIGLKTQLQVQCIVSIFHLGSQLPNTTIKYNEQDKTYTFHIETARQFVSVCRLALGKHSLDRSRFLELFKESSKNKVLVSDKQVKETKTVKFDSRFSDDEIRQLQQTKILDPTNLSLFIILMTTPYGKEFQQPLWNGPTEDLLKLVLPLMNL